MRNFRNLLLVCLLGFTILIFLFITLVISTNKDLATLEGNIGTVPSNPVAKSEQTIGSRTHSPECSEKCRSIIATANAYKEQDDKRRATILAVTPVSGSVNPIVSEITPSAEQNRIYEVPLNARSQDKNFNTKASVWHTGVILSDDRTEYYAVYVWSGKLPDSEEQGIGVEVYGPNDLRKRYNKSWTPPQKLNQLIITNASDKFGIISFLDASGKTGSLNLTTGVWTIR